MNKVPDSNRKEAREKFLQFVEGCLHDEELMAELDKIKPGRKGGNNNGKGKGASSVKKVKKAAKAKPNKESA